MTRLRVWMLTVLAALGVAGPTVAYWPVLFAVPAVFGQEQCPRAAQTKRTMPYAEEVLRGPNWTALICEEQDRELLGDCLSGECLNTWRKLWEQGRFREALEFAKRAVKAQPDNVDARHAFVVSQMVNDTIRTNAVPFSAPVGHYGSGCQTGTFSPPVGHYGNEIQAGLIPAGRLTTDLDVPQKTASCDFDCEMSCCPLAKFFATVFGGCKECAGSSCAQCPITRNVSYPSADERARMLSARTERQMRAKLECQSTINWKDVPLREVVDHLRNLTAINVTIDDDALRSSGICPMTPISLNVENVRLKTVLNLLCEQYKLGYVINDHCLQITTADKAAACCAQTSPTSCCAAQTARGPNGTTVIYIVCEPLPPMLPQYPIVPPAPPMLPMMPLAAPIAEAPLPPPYMAPPPPALISVYSETPYIPVPVVAPPPVALQSSFAYGYTPDGKLVRTEMPVPAAPAMPMICDPAVEACEAPLNVATPMPANVQITQHGSRVRLSSPHYHAQCDRIRGGADGQVILEGNVQLMSHRHGQTMSITAQRVLLNVKDDQFVVERAEGMESSRVNIAPVSKCGITTGCSPSDATSDSTVSPQEEARRIELIQRALERSHPDFFFPYINRRP